MREKLIELQKEAVRNCEPGSECLNCRYMGQADCMERLTADYMVANGVTVQKWISVKDRLPEGDHVLVFADGKVGESFLIEGDFFWQEDAISWEIEEPITEKVTHWMPMPKPPKEG